jgi:hypothetical protein
VSRGEGGKSQGAVIIASNSHFSPFDFESSSVISISLRHLLLYNRIEPETPVIDVTFSLFVILFLHQRRRERRQGK